MAGVAWASHALEARAWEPIDSTRPTWATAVPYTLQSDGSADLGFSVTEAEVRRGMDDWTRVACTSLRTMYRGTVSALPRSGDGQSGIGWLESGWPHDRNAIGVTAPRWWRQIVEADMQMNGVHFTWVTGPGRGSTVNTYSIVAHEGGHYYGLGHSSDSRAMMYFAYGGGIASIGSDDQNGICALYPSGSGSDCSTTGCPSGYTCVEGSCVRMMGDGGVCSPCDSSADCTAGICLGYPDGNGYCGRNCSTSADCGGDVCVSISGAGRQCVRVRGTTPDCSSRPGCRTDSDCPASQRCDVSTGACVPRPSGAALGAPCGEGSECSSGICFHGACSESCNWLEPTSCPSGFYCNGQVTGLCGAGLCLRGGPGGSEYGAPCESSTDCQSAFCAEGICSSPCIPGGAAACPAGFTCQAGALPGCGSCQQAAALGDACMTNEDCASRMCAVQADRTFCTTFCDAARPCPTGFNCVPVDSTASVCVPDRGGLGAPCVSNEACASGICASRGDRTYCTRFCGNDDPCPRDYACVRTADGVNSVCEERPRAAPNDCRCRAPSGSDSGSGGLLIAGLTWLLAVRHRRARRRPR